MKSFFKRKKVTAFFAIIALIGGIFFTRTEITGKVVFFENTNINPFSTIGILLLICSLVLAAYSLKK